MDPTYQDIQELRTKFNQRIQEEDKDFHPKDLSRASNDDNWLRRFLIHHDLDKKEALNMLLETCEWRKTNKVNDLNESTVNRDYLAGGSLFIHSKDKDGKPLFIFKCSKHVKGQKDFEELKKCVIYWFERAERMGGDQITIFFDMLNTGLSNMDMEYTKYLINLCKLYYPNFLNYILIFEMPWVLNTAFKIIKGWLPTKAVQKIKFVTRANLKEYVDPSQALTAWGGQDPYQFVFQPESTTPEWTRTEDNKKKVHFASFQMVEVVDRSLEDISKESNTLDMMKCKESSADANMFLAKFSKWWGDVVDDYLDLEKPEPIPDRRKSQVHTILPSKASCNAKKFRRGSKVRVNPSDAITFVQEGIEMSGSLTITNTSDAPITFKVKTTKPEKFRVRPYCGALGSGASVTINVLLLSGFSSASILQDKFLVMTLPLDADNPTTNQINEAWKNTDSQKVEEFKLRCKVSNSVTQQTVQHNGAVGTVSSATDMEQKISQLLVSMNHVSEICSQVEAELKTWRRLATALAVLCLVLGVVFVFFFSSESDSCQPRTEL